MARSRTSTGSVLLLILLITGVLLLLTFSGLLINSLLFRRSSAQDKTDSLSLELACKLNKGDRIGQINQLEARSRELVYRSRQTLQQCRQKDLSFLEPLCDELLIESRDGHRLLEKEKDKLINTVCLELQEAAVRYNQESQGHNPFKMAWLQTETPLIQRIEVGHLNGVESNVKLNDEVAELASYDLSKHFVLRRSHLFKADRNIKLPGEDADLNFHFASLPANIKENLSAARNFNTEHFNDATCIFDEYKPSAELPPELPGAIQVFCSMHTAIGERKDLQGKLINSSCAISNGAVAPSDN